MEILYIGCGAVGRALLELWHIEKKYKKEKITVIEPTDLPPWIKEFYPKLKHIKKKITKENVK